MPSFPTYDYIILGAGCSGLSLALRMLQSGLLREKRLLLIDRSQKTENDRTWCFWEKEDGFFESVVHHRYDNLQVHGSSESLVLDLAPYRYKMIRGLDFYRYCRQQLSESLQVDFRIAEIELKESIDSTSIILDGELFDPGQALVFNSIYKSKGTASLQLLQHFKGWLIKTEQAVFNPSQATFMDFRVSQSEGASFVYVLPVSKNEALVEYTLFTPSLLEPAAYDLALEAYIQKHITEAPYEVLDQEWGVIPMNNEQFSFFSGGHYQLGMAGGQTKPSTGFTFQFIQKQTSQIVENLLAGKRPESELVNSRRFLFYDEVLLDLLLRKSPPGDEIFTRLFARNKASAVFCFLDNETNISQELKLISSLPVWPFLKAALRVLSV